MSEFIVFLITFARIVPYDLEAGQASELIKVALKVHRDDLPGEDAIEYPREYETKLRELLPEHCRNLGPIVDIETIFEVEDRSQRPALSVNFATNRLTEQTTIYATSGESDKTVDINKDHPIYEHLLALHGFLR